MEKSRSRGSIKWKLMLLYAVLVVFVIAMIGTVIIGNIQRSLYSTRYSEMQYTAGRLADTVEIFYTDEEKTLTSVFTQVVSGVLTERGTGSGLLLYLLAPDRQLLYSRSGAPSASDLSSRTVLAAASGKESESLYVHNVVFTDGAERTVGDYAKPVYRNGQLWYILFLRLDMSDVQQTMHSNVMTVIMASLIAIAVTAFFAYLLAAGIARPIEKLTEQTQKMASGDLESISGNLETVSTETGKRGPAEDEIQELEKNFGIMASELARMFSEAGSEKSKLEAVFQHMADGLVVFDPEGNVEQCNEEAVGLAGAGIHNQTFRDIFPREDFNEILSSTVNRTETRMLTFSERLVRAVFASYRGEKDEPDGLIAVLQDVTEQQRAEEMQRDFVANVSHELRTPITTIKSYVETMLDGAVEDPEMGTQFLKVIDHESDRMTALITDLLELSRLDNRQVQLNLESMNFTDLLTDGIRRYSVIAAQKNQTLVMRPDCPRLPVLCDRSRMEQVVGNILANAINYSPEDTQITVWSSKDAARHEAVLHIQDKGVGIPYKEQKRVFERFYRIDKARSRSSGGTGLGLAIAKEMIELHKGRIELDSTPGKGSTFQVILPLEGDRP